MSKCTECKLAAICVPLGVRGLGEVVRLCGVCGKPAVYLEVSRYRKRSYPNADVQSSGWWRRVNPPCLSELALNPRDLIWCDTCSGRETPRYYWYDPLFREEEK